MKQKLNLDGTEVKALVDSGFTNINSNRKVSKNQWDGKLKVLRNLF